MPDVVGFVHNPQVPEAAKLVDLLVESTDLAKQIQKGGLTMMHAGYDVGRLAEERRRLNERVTVVGTALQTYAGTALRYSAFLHHALESGPYGWDSNDDSAKI